MKKTKSGQWRLTLPSHAQLCAAVQRRDAACDGQFFYGVVTTGVFCKPSCGSRQARAQNMRFFADAAAATAAGFRPCKRCHPDECDAQAERLVGVARYIEAHADERLTLAALARAAGVSSSRLQKTFTAAFGVSPKAYQDAVRLGRLKHELKTGGDVTGAIFAAGYGSTSRVYGEAARTMGMTPTAYRDGGRGETIYHAFRASVMGPLLMAATRRGVCFAQFGESHTALLRQLAEEFPSAVLVKSVGEEGPALDAWMQALDAHLERDAPRPDLPLDLRGTAFQLKVWRFLLSVREGDVLSYAELAAGIDQPRAVRAAASACGANRVSVLVPCHRILRGDGGLGGYRWGLERKRALLDKERRARRSD